MSRRNRPYAIPTPDGTVEVNKEVYKAWKKAEDKENYFMRTQKEERFVYDAEKGIAKFLPSREDSLNRLISEGVEFAEKQTPVEDQVETSMLIGKLFRNLSSEEKTVLYERFYRMMTLQSLSEAARQSRETYRDRFYELLQKCRDILENPLT